MADVIEQRRLTRTIVNGVDVGLVAIDADGAYDSMNPRHEEFMALAYPDGPRGHGRPGAASCTPPTGSPCCAASDMPTLRAVRGEAFRDYLIWVGESPPSAARWRCPRRRTSATTASSAAPCSPTTTSPSWCVASRIKDEFVASVSHELRTPLTSIIGYVDVILDDSRATCPSDVRGLPRHVVQRNARRLHRLVDDLLSTALQSVDHVLDIERGLA